MKSNKKILVSTKNSSKKYENPSKTSVDYRENSRNSSRKFFEEYNAVFSKPTKTFGDADSYYKYTLRNYEDFNLFKDLHKVDKLLKQTKSSDSVSKKVTKPKKKRFLISPRTVKAKTRRASEPKLIYPRTKDSKNTKLLNTTKPEVSDEEPEPELELFYSPSSERFETESVSEVAENFLHFERANLKSPKLAEQTDQKAGIIYEDVPSEEEEGEHLEEDAEKMAEDEGGVDFGEAEDIGDDEMKEVENIIKQATDELDQVAEENQQLLKDIEGGDVGQVQAWKTVGQEITLRENDEDSENKGTGESTFKFDPKIDNAVLRELEDAERQARETAKSITAIKTRVAELLTKEKMTETEAKELEQMNAELKKQMTLFEEKTKRIQHLITQANLFDDFKPPKPALQTFHEEDVIPKVIICGATENNLPKIILCGDSLRTGQAKTPEKGVSPSRGSPRSQRQDTKPSYSCGKGTGTPAMGGDIFGNNVYGGNLPYGGAGMNLNQPLMGMTPQNLSYPMRPPNMVMGSPQTMPSMGPYQNMNMNNMPPGNIGLPCARQEDIVPQLTKKLSDSIIMQEKLAADCVDLEGKRYKLQTDLLNKDRTVDCLQRQLATLHNDLRMVFDENNYLKSNLESKMQEKKPCPASVEGRLQKYSETTQHLEKQLADMEADVRNMQCELQSVQKERQHLEHHRKQLCPAPPPCPPPCPPPHTCVPPPIKTGSNNQHLNELKEQYCRLQDDFKGKLTEVACLRADNELMKQTNLKCEEVKKTCELKVKDLETELRKYKGVKGETTPREQILELEQELKVAKQRFREAQDELEELRAMIEDQQSELDDYRNKYMVAQQQVEEQKRQIDMMEMENSRVSEQVNLEIQRVKNQFQEKLQELTPLPEILKSTQIKLQEAQQMHLLAERNNEAMSRELNLYKEKVSEMTKELADLKAGLSGGEDDKMSAAMKIAELEKIVAQLNEEISNLKLELENMEDIAEANEKKAKEKLHEIAQLQAQLELVREESARQVARTKDRCETVRRSMQNQISELERTLAQSRAQAKAAQKDRDEIRQKMQAQIFNLNENFEDAQMRIRNLQGHVNFLKTSQTGGYNAGDNCMSDKPDPCNCGASDY